MSIPRINIRTLSELVSAVPALLGFVPAESMIAVLFSGDRLICATRTDIGDAAEFVGGQIEGVIVDCQISHAVIVVVSEQATAGVAAEIAERLSPLVPVSYQVHLSTYETGTTWHDVVTGQVGVVTDPHTTPVAVARTVQDGATIAPSRQAREALFDTTAAVETAFTRERYNREGGAFAGTVAADLLDVITGATGPTPELAARLAVLITAEVRARDALLWVVRTDFARAADTFRILAAPLRGEHRGNVLTLAAACYAYSGDALVNQALEAMERENLTTSLAELIDMAVRHGMNPATLTEGTLGHLDADYVRAALHGWTPPR